MTCIVHLGRVDKDLVATCFHIQRKQWYVCGGGDGTAHAKVDQQLASWMRENIILGEIRFQYDSDPAREEVFMATLVGWRQGGRMKEGEVDLFQARHKL